MKPSLHWAGYVARRLALAAVTFVGVTFLVFAITELAPGDPVLDLTRDRCDELDVEACRALQAEVRHELGLDRSLPVRYAEWFGNLLAFRLGRSVTDGKLVSDKLVERIPKTLLLNAAALTLVLGLSIPLGIALALRRGSRFDRVTGHALDLLYAAPYFWTALLLQYVLAVRLGWLPFGGYERIGFGDDGGVPWLDRLWHLILPACMLAYGSLAYFVRYVRTTVAESLDKPFVVTGRALGLAPGRLLRHHVLRHAAIALIPLAGGILGRLLAGSVVLETLFAWPGIGGLFSDAVLARDYNVIQALAALSAVMVLGASLLADLALQFADPRVSFRRIEG